MPNYEYQCSECKHLFEIWQPVGETPPACPECGSLVKKIFHAPRIIFKGSGFYVTDLRSEQAAKKSGGNTSTATETSEAGAAKTETSSPSPDADTSKSGDTAKNETKTDSTPASTNGSDQKSGGDHK